MCVHPRLREMSGSKIFFRFHWKCFNLGPQWRYWTQDKVDAKLRLIDACSEEMFRTSAVARHVSEARIGLLWISDVSVLMFCVSQTWVLQCSVRLIREYYSVLCVSDVSASVFCVSQTRVLQCVLCVTRECFSVLCVSGVSASTFCLSHKWVLQCSVCLRRECFSVLFIS